MRIAIVGTGISGLVCAHLLDPDHDVTVFEAGSLRRRPHQHGRRRAPRCRSAGRHRAPRRRHRLHRLQRAQLPELRAAPRPARRAPPSRSEMSFSVSSEPHRRSSTGAPTSTRSTPSGATCLKPVVHPDARRHRPLQPPARRLVARRGRRRRVARRLRRRRPLLPPLPSTVPRAARRVDLVGRPRDVPRVPRRAPTPASWTTTACSSCGACRRGARSPAAPSATSRPSPRRFADRSAPTPPSPRSSHRRRRGSASRSSS